MVAFCKDPFWDWDLTWNTETPDFTICFEESVLLVIPCLFLWLLTPYEVYRIRRSKKQALPWTIKNVFTLILSVLLCLVSCVDLVQALYGYFKLSGHPVDFCGALVKLSTFILTTKLLLVERKNGIHTSGPLFIFWLLLTIGLTISYRTLVINALDKTKTVGIFYFIIKVAYVPLVFAQFLLSCFRDAIPSSQTTGEPAHKPCPESSASFLSRVTYSWFTSLVVLGNKKPLTQNDMWKLDEDKQTAKIIESFHKQWEQSIRYRKSEVYCAISDHSVTPTSIFWPMVKTFWSEILFGALCSFAATSFQLISPTLLSYLIAFVTSDDPTWRGYFYAGLMFLASAGDALFTTQYEGRALTVCLKMRACMISTIYKKSLKLSSYGSKDFTTGEIVNLMAVDTQKVMDFMQRVNTLWYAPFQVIVCLFLLWQQLGVASLAGLATMILLLPVNGSITAKFRSNQAKLMKQKDKRSKLMNEILNGIKVIKLFSWEDFFKDTVSKARSEEVKHLRSQAYVWAGIAFVFSSTPFLVSLSSFVTFVLIDTNNVLDANKAFVSLSLFNLLRQPLNMLPVVISLGTMAMISVRRMNKYLNSDELDTTSVSRNPSEKKAVKIQNGTFSWGKDLPPVLSDINWTVPHKRLVAVVGEVGSGKSSLLAALLGDLEKRSGFVNVNGSLAYVPQQAWILNDTLRQNILFAKPMDRVKYKSVLEACALEPDLKILDGGDMCEIGEKGINLSGGQKQRVSLARAVYSDADIYLLDDPLSAVDSHVSKHLFDKVIGPKGMLKSKTRIIVTHRITILPQVDEIVVLKNGRITESGSYSDLLAKQGDFAEMIVQYLHQSAEDVEDPEEMAVIEELAKKASPVLERQFSRTSRGSISDKQSLLSKGRRPSNISSGSLHKLIADSQPQKSSAKLIGEEVSEVGSIKWAIYKEYFKSMGYWSIALVLFSYFCANTFNILTNLWLTEWSEDGEDPAKVNDTQLRDHRMIIYGALGAGETIFVLIATVSINLACLYAAISLHNKMLARILAAPMSFFDTTPIGRILNRFTKDVDTADAIINANMRMYIMNIFKAISTLILIAIGSPLFIIAVIPLAIIYRIVQNYYVATARQLRRIESVTSSPIYTHFSQTVNGANSIRAYGVNDIFIQQCFQRVDVHHMANYPSVTAPRWLSIRLGLLATLIVTLAAIFAVASRGTISPGLAGLSISYALTITGTLNMLVSFSAALETNVVSVERCAEYTKISTEHARYIESTKPSPSWPDKGEIKFINYSTAYRAGLNLVLKNVSFEVKAGEKVGVVGRTGAGKSSLTMALFRIIEPVQGTIIIDDVDISNIGLHELRSRLTIIPQDPVLFSGTIRMNLDPCGEVEDDNRLWEALELANLGNYVRSLESGLSHEITEGGENLSVGQRQLLCLGRAILRKSKILVLDEATAAVDVETDELIQKTIRSEFKDCTVLTIAHRLNTVMDYDKILVLSNGQVSEYDSPKALLDNTDSIFYGMAKDAGVA